MIKIFLSVRNRLSITTKCITALYKHSTLPHQIYVYDNLTNYKIDEHYMYFSLLMQKGIIDQVTFTSSNSTFNAFSKAASCNFFGLQHQMDPKKDKYDFLLFIDNDIIVSPGWDEILKQSWEEVKKLGLNNIKIISQFPGGIKGKIELSQKIAGKQSVTGKFGGSGFWSVPSNFFDDVGFLNLKELVGHHKKHDQSYWRLLEKSSGGKDYILGLKDKLARHCGGKISGSVCNTLTRNNMSDKKLDLIKFEDSEKRIDEMTFDEFYEMINKDESLWVW